MHASSRTRRRAARPARFPTAAPARPRRARLLLGNALVALFAAIAGCSSIGIGIGIPIGIGGVGVTVNSDGSLGGSVGVGVGGISVGVGGTARPQPPAPAASGNSGH